jgi:hypothetical protein
MTDYRFYSLGSPEHALKSTHHLLTDDMAALSLAQTLCDRNGIEIWEGQRRVARVKRGNEPLSERDAVSL